MIITNEDGTKTTIWPDTLFGIEVRRYISNFVEKDKVVVIREHEFRYNLFANELLTTEQCIQAINDFLIAREKDDNNGRHREEGDSL